MKVSIKDFGLDLDVKTKGMMLDVRSPDGKKFLGDSKVTKTSLTWCKGKSQSGPKVGWNEFIAWMESRDA